MEYLIIENEKIKGHYCSNQLPNGAIEVTEFSGQIGDPVSFYNDKWERKPDFQLMKEGLVPIPDGFKIEKDKLIPMSLAEKVEAGFEKIPVGFKLVNGEFVELPNEEKLANGQISKEEYETLLNEKILAELAIIDSKTVRPLRAILSGNYTQEDQNFLKELEKKAKDLRQKLQNK